MSSGFAKLTAAGARRLRLPKSVADLSLTYKRLRAIPKMAIEGVEHKGKPFVKDVLSLGGSEPSAYTVSEKKD